jgi:hypothetical protein
MDFEAAILKLRIHLYRLLFFFVLGYGFFYFSYKWLNPVVNADFSFYYGMIQHPFDFHAAKSPWVYRQWNAVVAHLFWRLHLYYPNSIHFSDSHYDQRIFFAALLTNFLSVVAAAWLSTLAVDQWLDEHAYGGRSIIVPLFAGMLCFFSFFLQTTTITGQADGLSWTFLALCYVFYRKRSLLPFGVVLFLSILQREILPIIFLVFACTTLFTGRISGNHQSAAGERRFLALAAAISAAAFAAYMLLRHWIAAPGNEYQTNLHHQLHLLATFRPDSTYISQVFLTQNLLALLAVLSVVVYTRLRTVSVMLKPLAAACIVLLIISVMTGLKTNAARMLALLTPIAAAEITIALISIESSNRRDSAPQRPSAIS